MSYPRGLTYLTLGDMSYPRGLTLPYPRWYVLPYLTLGDMSYPRGLTLGDVPYPTLSLVMFLTLEADDSSTNCANPALMRSWLMCTSSSVVVSYRSRRRTPRSNEYTLNNKQHQQVNNSSSPDVISPFQHKLKKERFIFDSLRSRICESLVCDNLRELP